MIIIIKGSMYDMYIGASASAFPPHSFGRINSNNSGLRAQAHVMAMSRSDSSSHHPRAIRPATREALLDRRRADPYPPAIGQVQLL
jgi:hypothetical protein